MNGSFIHHVTSGRNLRQRTQYLVSISCFNVLRHFAGRGSRFSIWRAAFTRHEELLHILRISCWYSPHLVLIVFWRQDHIPRGRALAYTILLSSLQIHVAIAHDMYTLCICRKFIYIYTAWCFTWFCWVVSVSIGCLQYLLGSTTNWQDKNPNK